MRRSRGFPSQVALLLALLLPARPLAAQRLADGAVAARPLVVAAGATVGPTALARADSGGTRCRALCGAGIGALAGAAIGATAELMAVQSKSSRDIGDGPAIALAAILGATVGAVVGLVIGSRR